MCSFCIKQINFTTKDTKFFPPEANPPSAEKNYNLPVGFIFVVFVSFVVKKVLHEQNGAIIENGEECTISK